MKITKVILCSMMLLTSMCVFAQKPVVVELWPNGAPNDNGLTGEEKVSANNHISNISKPTITVYPSHKANSKAIIMCPGGGYAFESMDSEGYNFAGWMNAINVTYVVLKYRLPNTHSEVPVTDVHQAFTLVRQHAKEWNVDPHAVGIMGASAGGHLAATGANEFTPETRPDFQVLFYPVITMDLNVTHKGTRKYLLGENPSDEMIKRYSMDLQVTDNTPRALLILCNDDRSVPPINSIRYYTALLEHHVSASMHIYPTGGHGFGFHDSMLFKRQWTGELEKWLSTF